MSDIPDPLNVLFRIEEMDNRLISFFLYVLRKAGGIAWPLVYSFSVYLKWNMLDSFWKALLLFTGIILLPLTMMLPCTWKWFYRKMRKDFRNTIERDFGSLFEAIRKENYGELTYGKYEGEVQKLNTSLRKFNKEYFPDKQHNS